MRNVSAPPSPRPSLPSLPLPKGFVFWLSQTTGASAFLIAPRTVPQPPQRIAGAATLRATHRGAPSRVGGSDSGGSSVRVRAPVLARRTFVPRGTRDVEVEAGVAVRATAGASMGDADDAAKIIDGE